MWDFDSEAESRTIFSDHKFLCCLTRKEKVFANYFSRWRTNTRKSPNRTWSRCLWAPGTWVTASNVFEFQRTLNHDGNSSDTVNQFSLNSQAMPVLRPTSSPGSSVRARGGRETTQRITSRTTSMSSALRRILWASGSGPTRWKGCWGRSPIWTSNKWATREAKWRLNAGAALFSLARYLLDDVCTLSGKFVLFADDTDLFYSGQDIEELLKMSKRKCIVVKKKNWFDANKLPLNQMKNKFMVFSGARSNYDIIQNL